MAGSGTHGGQRRAAEAGARVGHVHAWGGCCRVQVDVAVDCPHGAHGAQPRVHGAGRGIHLQNNKTWLLLYCET